MSKLSDRRKRHDAYHRRARKQGFRARAVFKLQEIDEKLQLLRPGARVLDLGCSPGSWLQYAGTRVGAAGVLVGLDRTELDPPVPGARLLVGDVMNIDIAELLGELDAFDVVLSDMAPDTSGVRNVDQARSELLFERALEIAEATLAPGGHFVGKLFQGPAFSELLQHCRRHFSNVKVIKPKGSRQASIEQYIVARGLKPPQPSSC